MLCLSPSRSWAVEGRPVPPSQLCSQHAVPRRQPEHLCSMSKVMSVLNNAVHWAIRYQVSLTWKAWPTGAVKYENKWMLHYIWKWWVTIIDTTVITENINWPSPSDPVYIQMYSVFMMNEEVLSCSHLTDEKSKAHQAEVWAKDSTHFKNQDLRFLREVQIWERWPLLKMCRTVFLEEVPWHVSLKECDSHRWTWERKTGQVGQWKDRCPTIEGRTADGTCSRTSQEFCTNQMWGAYHLKGIRSLESVHRQPLRMRNDQTRG